MGIWDKSEMLGGDRLEGTVPEGQAFILYGLKFVGEIDLDNGMAPAKKTNLLLREASKDPAEGWVGMKEGPVVLDILSEPIATMAQESSPEDFPVVAVWKKVATKGGNEAKVLDLLARGDKIAKGSRVADPIPDVWEA